MSYKLLIEAPDPGELEFVLEEKNGDAPQNMWIKGPYMMANEVNRNNRLYPLDEMTREVKRYQTEMIDTQRALGELNHPTSADVDLQRACHVVTELTQSGNYFLGKSKILSTPMGQIAKTLIQDGVKIGMSSRALGKLTETGGVNKVEDMRLVAIDCVADPSCTKAFVNGILENKNWILNTNGNFSETYHQFEKSLMNLPKHDVDQYVKDQVLLFISKIT